MRQHSLSHLHESGDVGTLDVIDVAVLAAVLDALLVYARHDLVQPLVHLFGRPAQSHRVLAHFQSAGGHSARIDGLARGEQLTCGNELLGSLGRAAHVRHLGHAQRLVGQYLVGIVAVQLVLCGTRQIYVGLPLPRLLTLVEGGTLELIDVGLADVVARGPQLQHVFYLLGVQSCRVVDVAVGSADGDDLGAQLGSLLGGTPCHVAEP